LWGEVAWLPNQPRRVAEFAQSGKARERANPCRSASGTERLQRSIGWGKAGRAGDARGADLARRIAAIACRTLHAMRLRRDGRSSRSTLTRRGGGGGDNGTHAEILRDTCLSVD